MNFSDKKVPLFLKELISLVMDCLNFYGDDSPYTVTIFEDSSLDDKFPVVDISPARGEISGGEDDGVETFEAPTIDLLGISLLFSEKFPNDDNLMVQYCEGYPQQDTSNSEHFGSGGFSPLSHISICTSKCLIRIFFEPHPEQLPIWVRDRNRGNIRRPKAGSTV
jgi:hypothetical protein